MQRIRTLFQNKTLNHILLYLVMISLPLIGVIAILQLGSKLTAPISTGGKWEISVQSSADCPSLTSLAQAQSLLISQSGHYIFLEFDDPGHTGMAGRLYGLTLTAATQSDTPTGVMALEAAIQPQGEPHHLQGELRADRCASPLQFDARRLPNTVQTEVH